MDVGHPVDSALAFVARFPSWRSAAPEVLGAFGLATAALWREIADEDDAEWKRSMAERAATLAHVLGGGL
ncbi:hypothetical protein GCM10011583_13580 [Streptomyces camponoticapitis]|uniref:Uncharacterized protein n=1 Tax=Streptomyces camponoticapitis TaxID=1616125 RepID=A0ABQ2E0P7_9ACTN|nr:hypothetical protein [Streptomyces camponoticapitis]GGJ83176.1 hypothetical protein GCM10011583_13580 [Streptomyces camponoticapitis]